MSYVYKITNTITGNLYVGKTTKALTERYNKHIENHQKLDTYLYRAMRKYGLAFFIIEIIEEVSDDILDERERFWIEALSALIPNGYNMTNGGSGGDTSNSPKYVESMRRRDVSGCKNPNYGKYGPNSPNYGKTRTEAQKENIHKGLAAAWDKNISRKQKLSENKRGKNNHMYGKKPPNALRVVFDGKIYDSLADAIRFTKHSPQYIKKNGQVLKDDNK